MALFFIAGCATAPKTPPVAQKLPAQPEGIYHKVKKGETLWSIAQTYGVSLEQLISANNIPDAARIEENQLILIPGASVLKEVSVPLPDYKKEEFNWPVRGKILSFFNEAKGSHPNRGIDIQVNDGDTVKAAREGKVVFADFLAGYGDTVIVDHGDGFLSVYAQNTRLLVKLGDHVYKGESLAKVGEQGRLAIAHFEVRKGQESQNPLHFLP